MIPLLKCVIIKCSLHGSSMPIFKKKITPITMLTLFPLQKCLKFIFVTFQFYHWWFGSLLFLVSKSSGQVVRHCTFQSCSTHLKSGGTRQFKLDCRWHGDAYLLSGGHQDSFWTSEDILDSIGLARPRDNIRLCLANFGRYLQSFGGLCPKIGLQVWWRIQGASPRGYWGWIQ